MNRDWFAFFSHTGTEIVNLSKSTGVVPSKIITNKSPGDESINKELLELPTEILWLNRNPDVSDYFRVLNRCNDCVCTLHGWMRLIPKAICEDYQIYNLHPGLITLFPELKGKDPQQRIVESHNKIGLVIHQVTPDLDSGPIVIERSQARTTLDVDYNTKKLHDMALEAWVSFFKLLK